MSGPKDLNPRAALEAIREELNKAPTTQLWPRVRELSEQGLAYVPVEPLPTPKPFKLDRWGASTPAEAFNLLQTWGPHPSLSVEWVAAVAQRGLDLLARGPRAVPPPPPVCSGEDFDRLVAWGRDYLETMAELLDDHPTPEDAKQIEAQRDKLSQFLDRVAPLPPTVDELAEAVGRMLDATPLPHSWYATSQYAAVQALLKRVPK